MGPVPNGTLLGGNLTLTWTPSTTVADQLFVIALLESPDHKNSTFLTSKIATSPLAITIPNATIPAGWTFEAAMGIPSQGASQSGVFVLAGANPMDQPFDLEGSLAIQLK